MFVISYIFEDLFRYAKTCQTGYFPRALDAEIGKTGYFTRALDAKTGQTGYFTCALVVKTGQVGHLFCVSDARNPYIPFNKDLLSPSLPPSNKKIK